MSETSSGADERPRREPLAQALVALYRYTVEMSEIAAQSLGRGTTENRDVQLALTLSRSGHITPTELAELTGVPRSTVSRALKRLDAAGFISRRTDARDRRSVLIGVTPSGRRRVGAFMARVEDSFMSREPLLKEAFDGVGIAAPAPDTGEPDAARPVDPLSAMTAIADAGAAFVSDVTPLLETWGVRDFADRFTLLLAEVYGRQRPTQIAEELRLTPSGTSGVLTRLERAGLISRRHDLTPGDRRAVIVELTPSGREAVDLQLAVFATHAEQIFDALALTWRSATAEAP